MTRPKPLRAERPSYDRSDLPDSDRDGLSDEFERQVLGTKPNRKDSDGDGLTDLEERAYGTDPTKWSSDADGLSDKQEYVKGTNPWLPDSDFDEFPDHLDRRPLSRVDPDRNGRDEYWDRLRIETKLDGDGDSLNDIEERWLRTNKEEADSDGDKFGDRDEVYLRTSPRDPTSTPVSSAGSAPDSLTGDDVAAVYIEQPAADVLVDPMPQIDDSPSSAAFDFNATVEPAADPYDIDPLGCGGEGGGSGPSPDTSSDFVAVDAFVDPVPQIDDSASSDAFDFAATVEQAADTYEIDPLGCGGEAGEL